MPADPETSREMGRLAQAVESVTTSLVRLEQRIETSWEDGRAETLRVYERIDAYSRESKDAISSLDRKVSAQSAELHAHITHDDARFAQQDRAIEEASKDRGRWWKALLGVSGAGTLGAVVAEWFKGGSGP